VPGLDRETLVQQAPMVAVTVFFGVMAWAHRWLHEDGLINVRVIENLLAGNGPVYNAGERVEAFTSPAQIALVSLARVLTLGFIPVDTLVLLVGVALSVTGLWAALRGAVHLWGLGRGGRMLLPVGALAFVAIPLTWDFATSGHEGSVGYAWIGLCFYGMARRGEQLREGTEQRVDRPRWLLVLLGSGALVRPEYAIFSLAFIGFWFAVHRGSAGSRVRTLAWMLGPSVLYQVFRMGYYGLLLPNTALAKLGGPLGLHEGLYYLGAFVSPFALWLPLVLLVVLAATWLRPATLDQRALVAAMAVPALVIIGYLAWIGGDYVNGRLLVVPVFALLVPVFATDSSTFVARTGHLRPVTTVAGVGIVLWAVVAASTLRPPWNATSGDFLDVKYSARELAIRKWVGEPPTSVADYEGTFLDGPYRTLMAQRPFSDGDLLVVDDNFNGGTVVLAPGQGPVVASTTIGALGAVGGINVRIIDRLALADPVASHLPATGVTAGHLRKLSVPWVYARAGVASDPSSEAAAKAMTCGGLADAMDAATKPMSVGRFLSNIVHSPSNTALKVPQDPQEAVDELC
jgi:arabinofuranosyltransferase